MIYITRPVNETQRRVPKTADKVLENNLQGKGPKEQVLNQQEIQKVKYDLQRDELQRAIEQTNQMIFKDDNRFEFKIHERTGRIMVKLVNNETNEIVKEIPPEKILDLVASIWDLVGILVDERG
ncbi:flagellar protein FlaG [Paratissierella segnis]|jgi:flagellar protein FlaG|uniref:Flagellar protein FlaG n=1 Tax=Paratissierella segnis TaxID=2763679 RepID=A0A926ERD2_9FIRM|nr:flagellar protein FlaG [Paratissierella segnis]MBC8588318.1 flagellar protein FlaG [Paratissierella segnis]